VDGFRWHWIKFLYVHEFLLTLTFACTLKKKNKIFNAKKKFSFFKIPDNIEKCDFNYDETSTK
jgi:hypothetical protein